MSKCVDFDYVPPEQLHMHDRLINWARWARPNHTAGVIPMFRMYRPYLYPECETFLPIDQLDAVAVQKTFSYIPEKQRHAIGWCYIIRSNPVRACHILGVSKDGMAHLIITGRTMITNRLTRMQGGVESSQREHIA